MIRFKRKLKLEHVNNLIEESSSGIVIYFFFILIHSLSFKSKYFNLQLHLNLTSHLMNTYYYFIPKSSYPMSLYRFKWYLIVMFHHNVNYKLFINYLLVIIRFYKMKIFSHTETKFQIHLIR